VVAVNQTRFQVQGVSEDKKHHLQITSYEVYALTREFYQVTNIQTVK